MTDPLKRLIKPGFRKRFEKIVNRMNLECANRIRIVSRDKYGERHVHLRDAFKDFKTVDAGHPHIEKNEIRLQRLDALSGFLTIRRLTNDADVLLGLEPHTNSLSGKRFVIRNQRTNRRRGTRDRHKWSVEATYNTTDFKPTRRACQAGSKWDRKPCSSGWTSSDLSASVLD